MAANPRVVLDTNVIISAIGYGGKPGKILLLALEEKIQGVTSEVLLAEVREILIKKLSLSFSDLEPVFFGFRAYYFGNRG
ncbi:putative toxin-antitoxin system toxin component, PIN family [Candidatus Microgenomates bacterium]|nr:putative toxin-antitoxin system toxin component, PIN family [Candidatus Microgenomates bacterium]